MNLNELRDLALKIAVEHGFKDATVAEDLALMHSEASEALEDLRSGKEPTDFWYEKKTKISNMIKETTVIEFFGAFENEGELMKPCGIPSEMADIIIRVLHFCGKHGIDIEKAVFEKMKYNETRPFKHGKTL